MTFSDNEVGKLFIGGLSWETTQEKLQDYFSRYGEVCDSVVMMNNITGRSRGFGFITFKDPDSIQIVLAQGPHKLDGKTVDPKQCTPRSQRKGRDEVVPKLFLGGLPPDITEDEVRGAFSDFGRVVEVNIMYDQEKRKCRGFGFLSFETKEATRQACSQHYIEVNGKQIECKLAVPKDSNQRRGYMPQQQYPQGEGGGGWGQPRMQYPPQQGWGGPRHHGPPPPTNSAPAYSSGWGAMAMPQQPNYNDGNYQRYEMPQASPYVYTAVAADQTSYSTYSVPSVPVTGTPAGYAVEAADPNSYATQDQSQYGAESKGFTAPDAYQGNEGGQDYSMAGNYGAAAAAGNVQPMRGYGQQQQSTYHPYRR